MSNETQGMTIEQVKQLASILVESVVASRLTEGQAEQLLGSAEELDKAMRMTIGRLAEAGEHTAPIDLEGDHASVSVPFTLEGVRYVAVGYLREGEESIPRSEAVARVGKDRLVQSEEDWQRIDRNLSQLPCELLVCTQLFTLRRYPDKPDEEAYTYLYRERRGSWHESYGCLEAHTWRVDLLLCLDMETDGVD